MLYFRLNHSDSRIVEILFSNRLFGRREKSLRITQTTDVDDVEGGVKRILETVLDFP